MAPPPEEWEEDEDEEDGDDPDGADGADVIADDYDVDQGGDEDDLESFFSEEGSSSSDSVRGHCWPDPFDLGTEASTPARSSRSPSVDDSYRLPSARVFASDDKSCGEGEASDSETALHDDYAVVLSAAAEIARCADARFGFVRRQAERRSVLRVQPLPKPLLEVLHARFSRTAASPPSTAEGQSRNENSCHGDFRSIPPTAWQSLFKDFSVCERFAPEATSCRSETAVPFRLDSQQGGGPRADGEVDASPSPKPPCASQPVHPGRPRVGSRHSISQSSCSSVPLVSCDDEADTALNMEAVLRAQMDAKQALMSVVLKVIFTMQLADEAPETAVAPPLEQPTTLKASPTDCAEIPQPIDDNTDNVVVEASLGGPRRKTKEACRRSCSKESGGKASTSSRCRKLIVAPRDRMRQPTRPRQPPPRPEKRPPVPRASRSATPSSKSSKVGEEQRQFALKGENHACTSSPNSSITDFDEVHGDDQSEPMCYEVSDEEFSRLMRAGALHEYCEHDGETFDEELKETQAYEVSDEEFERLLQAGVLSMAAKEEDAPTNSPCPVASSRKPTGLFGSCCSQPAKGQQCVTLRPPPPVVPRDAPQIRRRSEPIATALGETPCSSIGRHSRMPPKSAPPKPLGPKPAPKRIGKAGCDASMANACRGGLFFLPTDGVPAVSSRAAARGVATSSNSPCEEALVIGSDEMEFHDFMDTYHTAAAGTPLHSARLLRGRAAPRSLPSRWEEPPPPPMQRRAPVAPAIARFKSPGNLPRIDIRNISAPASSSFSEFGYENFSSGATSSAHCDFREDGRGFFPYEEESMDSRSLPTRSPAPGREMSWDGGVMPYYGPHGRRVPRKLAPLP